MKVTVRFKKVLKEVNEEFDSTPGEIQHRIKQTEKDKYALYYNLFGSLGKINWDSAYESFNKAIENFKWCMEAAKKLPGERYDLEGINKCFMLCIGLYKRILLVILPTRPTNGADMSPLQKAQMTQVFDRLSGVLVDVSHLLDGQEIFRDPLSGTDLARRHIPSLYK